MKKRMLSLLLSAVLLLSVIPFAGTVKAASEPHWSCSLTLQESIAINFKLDEADLDGFEQLAFYKGDTLIKTVTEKPAAVNGKVVFSFTELTPREMGTKICAKLVVNGQTYEKSCSVLDYCETILSNYYHTSLKTVVTDLLNYGAATQAYVDGEDAELVNADLSAYEQALGTQETADVTDITAQGDAPENAAATWKSVGLNLKDSVMIRFKFAMESTEGLTLKVTCAGSTWEITDFESIGDGLYYAYFSELNPSQMRDEVKAVIYSKGTQVSRELTYSVASYAAYVTADTTGGYDDEKDLVAAMVRYGDAVSAWIGGGYQAVPSGAVVEDGNYVLAAKVSDAYYAMDDTGDGYKVAGAAVTVDENNALTTTGIDCWNIKMLDETGMAALTTADGKYLVRASGKSSNLSIGDTETAWKIEQVEGKDYYTLSNTNDTESRYLAYSTTNTGFKAYAGSDTNKFIQFLLIPEADTPEDLSDISGNYVISYYDADAGKYKVMSGTVASTSAVNYVEATSLEAEDLPMWTIRMTASTQTDRTVTLQNDKGEYLAQSGANMSVQAMPFYWTVTEDESGNYRFSHNDGSETRYLMFTYANSGFKAYTANTDDRKDPLTLQKVSDLDNTQPTTYTQVTSVDDVTEGDYQVVVAYGGKYYLMTQTINSTTVALTAIECEVIDGTIVTYMEAFTFTEAENGFALAAGKQYVNNSAGSANMALSDTQTVWTVAADGDAFNLSSNGRLLMYSEDNAGFKSYAADKDDAEGAKFTSQFLLFKK